MPNVEVTATFRSTEIGSGNECIRVQQVEAAEDQEAGHGSAERELLMPAANHCDQQLGKHECQPGHERCAVEA